MKKRIVITGLGVLAANAQGKDAYWQALREGGAGVGPISLFDTSAFSVKQACEISDFDPKVYLGKKGLRTLDRSTKLLVSAAKLACEDGGLLIAEENTLDVGVSVGTTLGSIRSISEFDEVTIKEGPRYTNPALFPNTVINSPASQVSIWQNIKGFNTTLSTGFTASMDAMQYANDFLQLDRAKVVLAGGVEEMCFQTFYGFYALKFLSGSRKGDAIVNCPFDQRRNGITFGEGACLFVMETLEHAQKRQAHILGEVVSFGYGFDPYRINRYNPRADGLKRAISQAIKEAGLKAEDIDLICANANSTQAADKAEALAIKEIFGSYSKRVPVSAVKSMVGECYSVSGALNVAAALGVLSEGTISPTINYSCSDPDCDLNVSAKAVKRDNIKNILVNNFGPNGGNTCLILQKFEENKG